MFSNVHSVNLGSKQMLRHLHEDQMKRFRQAPRDEREKYAEQAAKYREMMTTLDIVGMLSNAGRW
jgi:hypothetical protein